MVNLREIKIYADGADLKAARAVVEQYGVQGFTTNPTLMRKAGVTNYREFARAFCAAVHPLPVSLEVFADDLDGMEHQARTLTTWGANVYVKIPVTDTRRQSTASLVKKLTGEGIRINVTAVFTKEQIDGLRDAFSPDVPAIISVFAGRIADAAQDPAEYITYAVNTFKQHKNVEILWASTREIYNVVQAKQCGVHIITVGNDLLPKLSGFGKALSDISQQTVLQFRTDALASGYAIE